jgi:squalene monooxygenase
MPGNAQTLPLATQPVPESGSSFDIIVIGGGVLGSSFATTFGRQGKRVLMLGTVSVNSELVPMITMVRCYVL